MPECAVSIPVMIFACASRIRERFCCGGWVGDTLWAYDVMNHRTSLIAPARGTSVGSTSATARSPHQGVGRFPKGSGVPEMSGPCGGGSVLTGSIPATGNPDESSSASPARASSVVSSLAWDRARAAPPSRRREVLSSMRTTRASSASRLTRKPVRHGHGLHRGSERRDIPRHGDSRNGRHGVLAAVSLHRCSDSQCSRRQRLVATAIRGIPSPDLATAFRAQAKIPPVYAPVEGIAVGKDATTWVRLRGMPEGIPWPHSRRHGCGDRNGDATARVSILAVDRNTAWGTEARCGRHSEHRALSRDPGAVEEALPATVRSSTSP